MENSIKVQTYKKTSSVKWFLFSSTFGSTDEDVIKLKSLATIKDIVLFAVSRCCDHYVNPNYSHLCLHV